MNIIPELDRRISLFGSASRQWPTDSQQYGALSRASNELLLFKDWVQEQANNAQYVPKKGNKKPGSKAGNE